MSNCKFERANYQLHLLNWSSLKPQLSLGIYKEIITKTKTMGKGLMEAGIEKWVKD